MTATKIILDRIATAIANTADELSECTVNRWCHPAHVFVRRWPDARRSRLSWERTIDGGFWNGFLLIGKTTIEVSWPRRGHRAAEGQGAPTV